jgi:prepilin-type N-terminal cleavage/methylation domain-containing protein
MSQNNYNKGFTLIELSIVLVIIGLLIGGVLVAQGMIKTAKINSTVMQIQHLDSLINNFQTKFNSLPGDSDKYSPNGDNDGFIESSGHNINSEMSNFWYHLSLSGDYDLNFSNDFSSGVKISGTNINAPQLKIGDNSAVLVHQDVGVESLEVRSLNAYYIMDCTGTTSALITNCSSSVYGVDALGLDTKIDDGESNDGGMRGVNAVLGHGGKFPSHCTENVLPSYLSTQNKLHIFVAVGMNHGANITYNGIASCD